MDLIEYSMFAHHFPEYTTETTLNCSEKSPKNVDNPSENTSNNFQISSKNFVFTLTPIKTTEVKVTCTDTVKDEQTIDKVSETPRHDEDDLSDSSERIFDSMLQSEIPEVTNHDSVNAKPKVEKSVEQTRLPKLVLKKARIIEKDEDDHTLRRVKKRKIIKETEDDDRVQKLEVKKARMKIANLRRLAKNQDKYKLTEKQVSYIKRKLSIIENTKRKITKLKKTREQAFCKVCKKSFSSKGALEMHSQQHFGYNFVCHICAKGTATNTALQRHLMNIHGLQKPYSCDLCNYKGVCKFQMKEHIRTHTGERPFTCDKCGLTFRRKAIWTEHQYLHGEKRFKCDQCPSGFYTRGQLNVHVNNIHKRQYVYQCTHPGCDTTYAKSTTVRRHLTSAHGVPRAQQGKITKINI